MKMQNWNSNSLLPTTQNNVATLENQFGSFLTNICVA